MDTSITLPERTCPTVEGHRCLDCAPATRSRPRNTEGLSNGSPFTQPAREATTAAAQPKPFLDHWERVEIPKPSATFDGAEAGTEGVVRITQPAKQGKRSTSAGSAKASLRASIPVTFTF